MNKPRPMARLSIINITINTMRIIPNLSLIFCIRVFCVCSSCWRLCLAFLLRGLSCLSRASSASFFSLSSLATLSCSKRSAS